MAMTLYGVGLGPGVTDLITIRGKRVLEAADVVYTPGRLSESVAAVVRRRQFGQRVPESRPGTGRVTGVVDGVPAGEARCESRESPAVDSDAPPRRRVAGLGTDSPCPDH